MHRRILAIHPAPRSFGYVVLESPATLIDWGVKTTRKDKNRATLAKAGELLSRYAPDVLVLEDCAAKTSRRRERIEHLLARLKALAVGKGVRVCTVSMQLVRDVFAARKREETVVVLAKLFPELAMSLPRPRKIYTSDDYRMAMFDAAGLALAYFESRRARIARTAGALSAQSSAHAFTQSGQSSRHRPGHKGDGDRGLGGKETPVPRSPGDQTRPISERE